MTQAPIIMTLQMDDASAAHFSALRRAHFPPEQNFLDAHITLFHHLPSKEVHRLKQDCAQTTQQTHPFCMEVTGLRMLGNGVAYSLQSIEAAQLRTQCSEKWQQWLGRQDQQHWNPHITVQNKVPAEKAKALHAQLSQEFTPSSITVTGTALWWYRGGPWELMEEFVF
jgi:2'-5' RNA ligase